MNYIPHGIYLKILIVFQDSRMVLVKGDLTKMEPATQQKNVKQKVEQILELVLLDMVSVAHVNINFKYIT